MKSRICPYRGHCHSAGDCENCDFGKTFEKLNNKIKRQNTKIERLEKEGEEVRYKLECLLCHSTGGRLSKSTYPLRVMETAVTDYINDCYDEIEAEVRAEVIKEFAAKLDIENSTTAISCNTFDRVVRVEDIDTLVKNSRKDNRTNEYCKLYRRVRSKSRRQH